MVFGEGAWHGKANNNNNHRMKGMCLFALTVVVVVVVDVCMILLERSPWQSQLMFFFASSFRERVAEIHAPRAAQHNNNVIEQTINARPERRHPHVSAIRSCYCIILSKTILKERENVTHR